MKKLAIVGILAMLPLLSGCGPETVEGSQTSAIWECLEKSLELQGYEFAESGQPPKEGDRLFELVVLPKMGDRSAFRFDPTAHIVIDYGTVMLPWPKQAYDLRCTGDFTFKILTSVQVNGRSFEPKPDESWFFGRASEDPSLNDIEEPELQGPENAA